MAHSGIEAGPGLDWIAIAWPMMSATTLTLGVLHLMVWLRQRSNPTHLAFFVTAAAAALLSLVELASFQAADPAHYAALARWGQLAVAVLAVALVLFLHSYVGTGRHWLAWSAIAARVATLPPNFLSEGNINFAVVESLRRIEWLGGGPVSFPVGPANPWMSLAALANLLLLAYAADTLVGAWRAGDAVLRRRALTVGGSTTLFVACGGTLGWLISHGRVEMPLTGSLWFSVIVVTMGYELGLDLFRAKELAGRLRSTEAQAREVERRMQLAVEAADVGLWNWDVAADRVWMTPRARQLLGVDPGQPPSLAGLLGRIHADDRERLRGVIAHAWDRPGDLEVECRVATGDGDLRWIALRGRAEPAAASAPRLLYGVALDVTARRRAHERVNLVVEASPIAMLMADEHGRIALANAQVEKLFGYAREELVGQPVELLLPRRPREHGPDAGPGEGLVDPVGATASVRESRARHRDGREFPVELGLSLIRSSDAHFVLAAISDLSARRLMEREAAQQRDELAHLARVALLGELSASLAHELNQPLMAIMSNAQAALRFMDQVPLDRAELRSILTDIVDNDRRAGEVIRRLRAMLRKEPADHRPLDLNEVVREVLRLMRSDLLARDLVAEAELAAPLPPVLGDGVQLQQVLLNLLVNAAEAQPQAGGVRRILVRTARVDPAEVLLQVADRGGGIADADLERVFEPFVTTKATGTGLGLAVCRTIVAAHGGRIWATRNPDRGSTLHVSLPRCS